jgi:hypothetical protein
MKRMIRLPVVVALLAVAAVYASDYVSAQDEAPKPSVTVHGTCVYLGRPRDGIVVSLAKQVEEAAAQEPEKEAPKPLTATTNEKGEYEFKSVPIGKYRLTAKGRPQNSIRAFKEADPVDFEITADTTSPVEKKITLSLDRAK